MCWSLGEKRMFYWHLTASHCDTLLITSECLIIPSMLFAASLSKAHVLKKQMYYLHVYNSVGAHGWRWLNHVPRYYSDTGCDEKTTIKSKCAQILWKSCASITLVCNMCKRDNNCGPPEESVILFSTLLLSMRGIYVA